MKVKWKGKVLLKKNVCVGCGKRPSSKLHTCPYEEEINDDKKTLCNCCKKCTLSCVDGI